MWPLFMGIARTYAPYIIMPFAAVVGFVGYQFEWYVRGDVVTPAKKVSIADERDLRRLNESEGKDMTKVDLLKDHTFVPKTIFDRVK